MKEMKNFVIYYTFTFGADIVSAKSENEAKKIGIKKVKEYFKQDYLFDKVEEHFENNIPWIYQNNGKAIAYKWEDFIEEICEDEYEEKEEWD